MLCALCGSLGTTRWSPVSLAMSISYSNKLMPSGDCTSHYSVYHKMVYSNLITWRFWMQNRMQELRESVLDDGDYRKCLFALSIAAQEHNLTCPIILPSGSGIQIKEGRHPLQELNVESFVPNDFQSQRIHILTGPNACGKSVYLKQVALITYLAHLGSYVPAREAKINIVDHIHCRINTAESTEHHLSAFMTDLRQVTTALLNSSRSSLIILDEFGKGTLEMDGLALLASSLNHLIARREDCPLMLTFKYRIEDDDIVYLFSIEQGRATCSLAHQVALNCGLSPAIVSRGQDILEAFRTNRLIQPLPDQARTMRLNRVNAVADALKTLPVEREEDLQKLIKSLRQLL
ncbi:hypothetical protein M8J76_009468 [Diaphorina citri]|nr:hypothetical protein M8J76_009468 [Diaphorina citri]